MAARQRGSEAAKLRGCEAVRLRSCEAVTLRRCCMAKLWSSEAARQRDNMAARWRGSEAAKLRDCEAVRLRSCEAVRLRGCGVAKLWSSEAVRICGFAVTHTWKVETTKRLWLLRSDFLRLSLFYCNLLIYNHNHVESWNDEETLRIVYPCVWL